MQFPWSRKPNGPVRAVVEFRTLAHFYDADDPTPMNNRELTDRAEKEILRQVLSVPADAHKEICDQLEFRFPESDLPPGRAEEILSATRSYFRLRADQLQRDRKLIKRVGFREFRLTIAVCIPSFLGIAVCSQFKGDPLAEVIENVLVIFCWVTIWAPFQSLVFDRWTQSATAKVFTRISEMDITISPVSNEKTLNLS